jgi:hypothetical protein
MTGFKRWLGLILALPGMAAIVLPFYYGVSPMKVIMEVGGAASRTSAADYLWIAIPFFAAPMILDWQVRRARGMRMGWLPVFIWHATAVAAVAPMLVAIFRAPSDAWAEGSPALLPVLAAIVVYGALVARCLGRRRPADETAGVAMNSAYLPNAILCLITFATPDGPGALQVGAWVTLVACACSIIQIVLVMRAREGAPVLDLDVGQ